jgi:integrase
MGIKRLENGNWEAFVSIRHPETRRPYNTRRKTTLVNGIRKPITSRTLARKVEREIHHEIMMKFKVQKTLNIKDAVNEYIDWCKGQDLKEETIKNRMFGLKAYAVKEWGSRLVDDINPSEIRELIHNRLATKSASQKKNVLKYIRLMFQYLVDKGDLSRNPSPEMKFKIGDKLKICLTPSEVKRFLEHAKAVNSEWYPVWATAIYTGMRNSELLGLTWDDISFELNQIRIKRTYKPSKLTFFSTKSMDERIVDIAPPLIPILKELKLKNENPPFVLPRIDKWDKGEQARELRTFLMGMGLPRIRFHDLRATWATILLSQGIPATVVMAMGGWKDIKTVQHYLRLSGVNTKGALSDLELHDPYKRVGKVLSFVDEG